MAAGLGVACRSLVLLAVFACVFVFIYLPVIALEEQHLRQLFPEFEHYAASVSPLFPNRRPISSDVLFSWVLYRKNKEYQAVLGFLLGVGWLVYRLVR
jgi:hypothetical protein